MLRSVVVHQMPQSGNIASRCAARACELPPRISWSCALGAALFTVIRSIERCTVCTASAWLMMEVLKSVSKKLPPFWWIQVRVARASLKLTAVPKTLSAPSPLVKASVAS